MNELRTTVYGLPRLTLRPFAGADVDYINCIVQQNRSRRTLEHYPSQCGRTVNNGGAEVLAWNWSSLGGTTNDLVHGWNNSDGHRRLMLGTGDQVSAGVFCIGRTAYGVAWFRRADGAPAGARTLVRKDPPNGYSDWFGQTRFPMFTDNTSVCGSDGLGSIASRPHSDFASTPSPPENLDQLIDQQLAFTQDQADILRLYQAYFSRRPDLGGADYWLGVYDAGSTTREIAGFMAGSIEFGNTFGAADDAEFLRRVYRNALDREPDSGGYNYWLDLLQRGELTRIEALFYVAFGDEFRANYSFGGL